MTDLIIDGRTGLLFDMEDGVALADCVERLINHASLRQQITDQARRYVQERLAPEKTSKALDEALYCVLER